MLVILPLTFNAFTTFPLKLNPTAFILPPVIFAAVVIFEFELIALNTLPLRLRLTAFTLPLVTLPMVSTLPPVMFPMTLSVAGFKLPTKLPKMLPPVMLPVALIYPDADTLPKFKSVMLTLPKISPPTYKLPAMPTPPATARAPVVVLVLSNVLEIVTGLV